MDITITASGSRQSATASVREQVKQLRATPYKQHAALLSALGDDLTRTIGASSEPVAIKVTLKIEVTETKPAPAAGAVTATPGAPLPAAAPRASVADSDGSVTVGTK